MLFKASQMPKRQIDNCHDGQGSLTCIEMLRRQQKSGGFRFVHDDVLPPGATIGQHTHKGDEEIYLFLEGRGTMYLDGEAHPVGAGDLTITGDGHSHGLVNDSDRPMRFLVIAADV